MTMQEEIRQYLLGQGVSDVGFARVEDGAGGLPYSITLVVKLSDAIVEEITDRPTHTYFNHYRTVNAFLDQMLLKTGLLLERAGYRYLPVAASQSINEDGWSYRGRYSHKKAACLAGLGTVGRSSLFLHHRFGARVRLATLFTNCPFEAASAAAPVSICATCRRCVSACPAGAILGGEWNPATTRAEIFDPEKCSRYMKTAYQKIGRGAVCGICMRVCPAHCSTAIPPEKDFA